jgi:hypothetical protein
MATTSNSPTASELSPPYLAFTTFQSAVDNLRTHGVPDPIDRTTWDSRSGTDQVQIAGAFKFLGLVDDGNHPTPELRSLVNSTPNTEAEKVALRGLVQNQYSKLMASVDLKTATPGQLEDAIEKYGVSGATRDRAVRFFLKAASYCEMPLSSRLTRNLRVRADGTATAAGAEHNHGTEGASPVVPSPARKRRRRSTATPPPAGATPASEAQLGNAMKTVSLSKVKGTLTISGTFNAFGLSGEERKLVYDIIDMMNAFEAKASE